MINVKDILESVKSAPKEFPVETAIGLTYSVAMMLAAEDVIRHFSPLMFVFVIFAAAITLRRVNRRSYYASYLLIWVVYALFHNADAFKAPWYWVLNIICAIVLCADIHKSDNKGFANTVICRIGELGSAALLSAILSAMVSAIIGSVMYLFDTEFFHLIIHVNILIVFLIMPLMYCHFQAHGDEVDCEGGGLVRVIVDYIVSPALVVYTFVLLVYILKIVVVQELPRGGVAYMVSIYIALVLVGNLLNKLVRDSHFNWFYDNFAYIAIAPIVLLWVGTIYRINEYGLTEWRVYLLIVNVLMTIFPLMLKIPRLARYNLMTVMLMTVMVIFTCIPPISARSIGIRNQNSRFLKHADMLGVIDHETGQFKGRGSIDMSLISADSTLNAAWDAMKSEMAYLDRHDTILRQYGNLEMPSPKTEDTLDLENVDFYLNSVTNRVSTEGYPIFYRDFEVKYYSSGHVKVYTDDKCVMDYDIKKKIMEDSLRYEHLDQILVHRENDYMIVIEHFDFINGCDNKYFEGVYLFGKK